MPSTINTQDAVIQLDILEAAKRSVDEGLRSQVLAKEKGESMKMKFKYSLTGGDRLRGEKVFYENGAIQCIQCHQAGIKNRGGPPVPDYTP